MANPKGVRNRSFKVNDHDSVFIYSDPGNIWLQLRRDYPTQKDIGVSSFKSAVNLTPALALELASELLKIAASHQNEECHHSPTRPPEPTPANHGKQWDEKEEKQLLSRFNSGLSIADIAKKHKRGIGGIQSRLVKLGKIEAGIGAS